MTLRSAANDVNHDDEGQGQAMDEEQGFEINGAVCIHETKDAILVRLADTQEFWVPKSVIHDNSEVYSLKNSDGTLIVKEWWAESRGML